MSAADAVSIDLIQELRLRKWAREHYVSASQRGRTWHPIVLEEMQFRDEELRAAQAGLDLPCSPYVPLAPLETCFLDDPHAGVPEPKSLPALAGAAEEGSGAGLPFRGVISSFLSARRIRS